MDPVVLEGQFARWLEGDDAPAVAQRLAVGQHLHLDPATLARLVGDKTLTLARARARFGLT